MGSVSERISKISQPRGGYIKPTQLRTIVFDDGVILNENENISPQVVGMAVDYLSRLAIGTKKEEAFSVSLGGAQYAETFGFKNAKKIAMDLLKGINGFDSKSVVNACKLVTFDVWLRNPFLALESRKYNETNPDKETVQNIQTLVARSVNFIRKFGPIIKEGFTFEPVKEDIKAFEKMMKTGKGTYGGYTASVSSGDGDFLTSDTLWDFKVLKSKPNKKHTLQILMYWIMGQHSGQKIYRNITKIGIFNPRLNTAYLMDIKDVPSEVIRCVEQDVICYD